MKFRIKLFAIISGIFIPLNSANAFSEAEYFYGYYWGSLNAICGAYMIDAISERDADMMLNSLVKMGNEEIKDSKLKKRFNYLVKTDENLKKKRMFKTYKIGNLLNKNF